MRTQLSKLACHWLPRKKLVGRRLSRPPCERRRRHSHHPTPSWSLSEVSAWRLADCVPRALFVLCVRTRVTSLDVCRIAGERDAATARSESLGSEIAALRARMGDFEADRATITRENAQALAALRERLGSAEAARDACRVDLSAAEARAQAMRQQVCAQLLATRGAP